MTLKDAANITRPLGTTGFCRHWCPSGQHFYSHGYSLPCFYKIELNCAEHAERVEIRPGYTARNSEEFSK